MNIPQRLLLAALLGALAQPSLAAEPEWRGWGEASAGSAPPGAAQAPAPAPMLGELMQRQQQLQQELRDLRDLVERQGHEIEMLKRASKDSYADIDRRLRALEQPASQAPVVPEAATPPVPPAALPAAPTQAESVDDKGAYEQAFALLKEGKYDQAIKAFDAFVQAYPASPYVPNAQYWAGEARYVQGDLKGAMQQFEKVVQGAPAHPKVPDALLKMGFVLYDQKDYAKAREVLTRVKEQFPGSQAAVLADQRLKRMQQEGV